MRRSRTHGLLDLEVALVGEAVIRLDHSCPGDGTHRLLAVELTEREQGRVRAGRRVTIPVRCDRCLWERRLVITSPRQVHDDR